MKTMRFLFFRNRFPEPNSVNPAILSEKHWFWLAAIVLCSGCTKVVEIELPAHQSRLVVNSVINPDSTVKVAVYQSLALLDQRNSAKVTNAAVTLYEDNTRSVTLRYADSVGLYVADFKPTAGRTYRLTVSAPGLPEARAVCTVPPKVNFTNVQVRDSATLLEGYTYLSRVTGRFTDRSGPNYYHLFALQPYVWLQWRPPSGNTIRYDTIYTYNPVSFYSDFSTFEYTWGDGGVVFNDAPFNGRTHDLVIDYFPNQSGYNVPDPRKQRFWLYFRHTDAFYYEYYRKLERHFAAQDGGLFAGEPLQMPTNIENGFGIFAAFSQSVVEVY